MNILFTLMFHCHGIHLLILPTKIFHQLKPFIFLLQLYRCFSLLLKNENLQFFGFSYGCNDVNLSLFLFWKVSKKMVRSVLMKIFYMVQQYQDDYEIIGGIIRFCCESNLLMITIRIDYYSHENYLKRLNYCSQMKIHS